ncbi:helix-turn-helix domain-containing protein [Fluviibacterium sp. DFM31]|uniref:Helix-turn-helix domain-containing protein n=1 Tax=Meridianimarinicoccus marinus TaxID=3231483 RepID=A0ABV3L3E6_9RHOB
MLQVEGLSPTAKTVAGALAIQFANDETGRLNPSQATLADYLKVHRDTFKRALRKPRNAGWLMSFGDGGHGNAPEMRLLSPSKIVPFRREKGGEIAPVNAPERGADLPPQRTKRGGGFAAKGGRNYPPLYKDKQSLEQKGAALDQFASTRFEGNAFDGLVVIPSRKWDGLNEWAEWLAGKGFPELCNRPVIHRGENGERFYRLPSKKPPTTERGQRQAVEFFAALVDGGEVLHAAQ